MRKALLTAALAAAMVPSALAAEDFRSLLESVQRLDQCLDDPECRARMEREDEAREAAEAKAYEARMAAAVNAARALGRKPETIQLGDDSEYVQLQWGEPERTDRIVSSDGVHEWWWYGSNGVHFANGRVDSIHTGN